jgi:hypothetical protein
MQVLQWNKKKINTDEFTHHFADVNRREINISK